MKDLHWTDNRINDAKVSDPTYMMTFADRLNKFINPYDSTDPCEGCPGQQYGCVECELK